MVAKRGEFALPPWASHSQYSTIAWWAQHGAGVVEQVSGAIRRAQAVVTRRIKRISLSVR
jgi:hypothetical protein